MDDETETMVHALLRAFKAGYEMGADPENSDAFFKETPEERNKTIEFYFRGWIGRYEQ